MSSFDAGVGATGGRLATSDELAGLAQAGGATPGALALRRLVRNRLSIVGLGLLGLILLLVLIGPLIWTQSPTSQNLAQALAPPSAAHPLGLATNRRDVL